MAPEVRIDADYNPNDDDLRMLLKGMHRMLERGGGNHYHEGGGGEDNKRLLGWILTVTSLLAVAAISGGVVMYGEVSSLKAMVTQWQISSDRRQDQTEHRLDLLESRPR